MSSDSMPPLPPSVSQMMDADGFDLIDRGLRSGVREIAVVAREGACADCLVPKAMMIALIRKAAAPMELGDLLLEYPNDKD